MNSVLQAIYNVPSIRLALLEQDLYAPGLTMSSLHLGIAISLKELFQKMACHVPGSTALPSTWLMGLLANKVLNLCTHAF